ncbi:MAG: hypothetical protein A2543_00725 [Candidatus Komeilibacteria bacterium RIFOXYD2_FULL_37_8]|nr:MAG: hypothetical protein A2543_00725 [Candidatus Komeilibacteria bacterium RIFOXYD2_FULL_37_8]
MFYKNQFGFTLVQLIVSMTSVLVLSAAVFLWIDPLDRMGDAQNKKRTQDVSVISAALFNYAKEHSGMMPVLGELSTSKKVLCSSQSGSELTCGADTELCLTIDDQDFYKYLRQLPYDPDKSSAADTGYYLFKNASNDLIVGACSTHDSETITKNLSLRDVCASGAYGGGHCWYLALSTNIDCDDTCAALNLNCVRNARYGPDVIVAGSAFCRLNKDLGSACSTSCTISATGTPPLSGDICTIQNGAVICSEVSGASQTGICPCQ